MKLHHLINVNAVLSLLFGIAFTLYGPLMMAFFGIPEIPEGNVLLYWHVVAFARMFGVALLGVGLILWSLRKIAESNTISPEIQRGMTYALILANGMGIVVALTQQAQIWSSPAGWATVAVFTLLFVGYVYLLVVESRTARI
jgi:hypothetical protein